MAELLDQRQKVILVDLNSEAEDYPKELIKVRETVSFLAEQLRLLDSHPLSRRYADSVISLAVELNSVKRRCSRAWEIQRMHLADEKHSLEIHKKRYLRNWRRL